MESTNEKFGDRERVEYGAKVQAIFRELVGERGLRLAAPRNHETVDAIARVLSPCPGNRDHPEDGIARDIAFHLTDWGRDAAFIVALHLFPERFTPAEIEQGVDCFLVHVPNHVAAAAVLSGHPVEDIFEVGVLNGSTDDDEPNIA